MSAGSIAEWLIVSLYAALVVGVPITLGVTLFTPKRFSLRGLLILTTYIAFMVGLASALYRMKNN